MKKILILSTIILSVLVSSCKTEKKEAVKPAKKEVKTNDTFVEEFADIKVLRYKIPQWDKLSLRQKKLVYFLTQAGLAGRDIMYDQNYRHNLTIRRALENIYTNFKGDKTTKDWQSFETYLKQVWFANGIHHHYSNDKFTPNFSKEYLVQLITETKTTLAGEALDVIFNDKDTKKVNLDPTKGLIEGSAINMYGLGVTTNDVENFYAKLTDPNDKKPVELGLNSQLVKEKGAVKNVFIKAVVYTVSQ